MIGSAALLLVVASVVTDTTGVAAVYDANTIVITSGMRVNLVGVGNLGGCEGEIARRRLEQLVADRDVALVRGTTTPTDIPPPGSLLRYVQVPVPTDEDNDGSPDGVLDVGAALVAEGLAPAQFDSRDGHDPHERENAYIMLDDASPDFECSAEQEETVTPRLVTNQPDSTTSPPYATPGGGDSGSDDDADASGSADVGGPEIYHDGQLPCDDGIIESDEAGDITYGPCIDGAPNDEITEGGIIYGEPPCDDGIIEPLEPGEPAEIIYGPDCP
jgi:hypothetical protein